MLMFSICQQVLDFCLSLFSEIVGGAAAPTALPSPLEVNRQYGGSEKAYGGTFGIHAANLQ